MIEKDQRQRVLGKTRSGAAWPLAVAVGAVWLMLAGDWAQSPAEGMKLQVGEVPIEFTYDSFEIDHYNTPDEIHRAQGAQIKAFYEGATVVLAAPYLTYASQQGVFSASSGVTISDGTLTVQAQQGEFDIARKVAQFEGEAKWERRQKNGQTSWGQSESITLYFGKGGVQKIVFGSDLQPGRMFLFPEKGAIEMLHPAPGQEGKSMLDSPPPIERALTPLENSEVERQPTE